MTHGGEELALRLIGVLGPFSRLGVTVDLDLQPGVGIGELCRAFRYQHLEFALVPPELQFRSLAFPFELAFDHPLFLEHLHCFRHLGQLVAAAGRNHHVEVAPCELLHDQGQGLEPCDDVALHVQPENQPRDREHHHGLEEQRDKPCIHGLRRSRRGVLGEQLRLLDQLHDEVAERFGERAVAAGEGFDLGIELQHLPPQAGHVVRAGGVGVQQYQQKLPSLPQANRVGNAAYPPIENPEVVTERAFDPLNLVTGARHARAG